MTSEEQKAVDYLKRALVDLNETRQRLEELEARLSEPIAIIGMSCRYPGGVTCPQDLWDLVSGAEDGISGLPEDRGWDLESLCEPGAESSTPIFKGGFIRAEEFDADFFGISYHQSLTMDPQQRLLLETTWEACEDAGIDPTQLRKTNTGVFVGLSVHSYASFLFGAVQESPEGYISSGNAGSMASGRIASLLGLEGPAATVDTACSSSAMALHLACQSLRGNECSLAIAGGVTVMSTPWMYAEFRRQALFPLSSDGRCRSFADGADGTTFSEGVGVVMLERLSDARRLGHEVLAVVRGSAVNQDGISNGLTAPNGLAHERVIEQALANAGVSADQIDVVEGHGMGTVLGDPIEAQALLATYGRDRQAGKPIWLGSIKSNIGHTQAASTMAGVIKMVMAIRHALMPKTLHVDLPTRHVDWSSGGVSLLVEPVPWRKEGDLRRAAIHSLGMSGTNIHIILEEAEHPECGDSGSGGLTPDGLPPQVDDVVVPWVFSGRDERGLRRQARRLADFIADRPDLSVVDVGYSLATGRAVFGHRAVAIGANREQLLERLSEVADGESPALKGDGHEVASRHGVSEASAAPRAAEAIARAIGAHDEHSRREALACMAELWVSGTPIDWREIFLGMPARRVRLPTYAFDRRRHWPDRSPIWDSNGLMAEQIRSVSSEATHDAGAN